MAELLKREISFLFCFCASTDLEPAVKLRVRRGLLITPDYL